MFAEQTRQTEDSCFGLVGKTLHAWLLQHANKHPVQAYCRKLYTYTPNDAARAVLCYIKHRQARVVVVLELKSSTTKRTSLPRPNITTLPNCTCTQYTLEWSRASYLRGQWSRGSAVNINRCPLWLVMFGGCSSCFHGWKTGGNRYGWRRFMFVCGSWSPGRHRKRGSFLLEGEQGISRGERRGWGRWRFRRQLEG